MVFLRKKPCTTWNVFLLWSYFLWSQIATFSSPPPEVQAIIIVGCFGHMPGGKTSLWKAFTSSMGNLPSLKWFCCLLFEGIKYHLLNLLLNCPVWPKLSEHNFTRTKIILWSNCSSSFTTFSSKSRTSSPFLAQFLTVDGRNSAPLGMYETLWITVEVETTYQLVQDSFQQQ